MMEAQSMGMPLLQIGGAVAMDMRDAGDLQDMNTLNVMETCSGWARKVASIHRIPEYVSIACRHAMDAARPGPVYLEIPTNLLFAKVDETLVRYPEKYRTTATAWGDPALIEQAAELLANAKQPAMLVDNGARFSMGEHAGSVAALSEHLKMPIGSMGYACRGLFGDEYEHPLYRIIGAPNADVILALGCRFDFRWQFGRTIKPDARVIQVHTDSSQIGFNLRADLGIVGGSGPVAKQLLDAVKARQPKPRTAAWILHPEKGGTTFLWNDYRSPNCPIHPARCAGEVAKFLEDEARDWTIVIDGGEAAVWMGIAATASRPGQLHSSGSNGTIGTGPGLVVGAWTANRKPVLWYSGDGSFGFYALEMDTMARLGIPVICVISNDSAWGMIRLAEKYIRPQEIEKRGHCHVELHHMRSYEKMVDMWGGHGEVVTDPDQIVPAIRRAVANGNPSIINVEVDHVSLSPMIAGYASMVAPEENK
jgi:acetolactate synthase-1/2/3 large subunit